MFSSNLKRSFVTIVLVAGALAAAGPAGSRGGDAGGPALKRELSRRRKSRR